MLVVKAQLDPGGDANTAKEIGRLKIISQNPFDRSGSQISSYTYEMADPSTAPFPLKGVGSILNHFRQQPVWILVEKVLRDMNARGLFAPYRTGQIETGSQAITVKVELWDGGDESMAAEIGRLKISGHGRHYSYELTDPKTSNLALQGAGALDEGAGQHPVWALVETMLADMRKRGIIAAPEMDTYAAVGHAWLKSALAAPGNPANAGTCFRAALNAYTYAFQRTAELSPDLRETLRTLMDRRETITAGGDKGINARYAWILKHGFMFCGPGDPLHDRLEQACRDSEHFMQRPESAPVFDRFIAGTWSFIRQHLHIW
jgi:hypothetical protein